ncbi:hypothetical protein HXX76_013245 [Chlamydomonas incerta]|uniref:Peptidase M11 gametolysin domain-containing protein n=1 Tax=Chlamydomonas incerta TaxID=51695 RepID=A0A835VSE2_CHLIN|nr:hypothetical protein HXX76_013245 [Chlamydomonas incerta]|eukprot:KAG2426055.1 hypothetical protein HXX76_013245 [Chlamydomonas incerta]
MLRSDQPDILDFEILEPGSPKEVFTGEPIEVSSYIYVINTCGWPQSTTADRIRQLYFTGSQNIEDYHSTCSYNKVFFRENNTRIFDNINVPCNGTVQSGVLKYNYDGSKNCGAAEQFAWRMAGENLARSLGFGDEMDSTQRRRLIVVLPTSVKCGWAGLGSVGCSGRTCSVYIKGGYANDLLVHMHELGHTQGLSHAGRGLDEYGDKSDIMGTAGSSPGYLCMNAGNQLRVGWNSPIVTLPPPLNDFNIFGLYLDGTSTGVGGRWELPEAANTDINHVFLNFNSLGGVPFPNTFISFRSRSPTFDNILSSDLNNKVLVHFFNGSASERDYNRTLLVGVLGSGQSFTSPYVDPVGGDKQYGGGWKVTVLWIQNGQSALIQLCRMYSRTDCSGAISPAPIPTPSASSPPPPTAQRSPPPPSSPPPSPPPPSPSPPSPPPPAAPAPSAPASSSAAKPTAAQSSAAEPTAAQTTSSQSLTPKPPAAAQTTAAATQFPAAALAAPATPAATAPDAGPVAAPKPIPSAAAAQPPAQSAAAQPSPA